MFRMQDLPVKKQRLLAQSLADFDARWDEGTGLLISHEDGHKYHATRESVFYALALLIRQGAGDAARADRTLRAVMALQRLDEDEIWHGTFAYRVEQPMPPRAPFPVSSLTPEARWQADLMWERIGAAFRRRLEQDPALAAQADAIRQHLESALEESFPVVWRTYDPNWREFLLSSFALILEEFESLLPAETVKAMENAARAGLKGARARTEQGLTPLNTNVKVMHAFLFDAFARRFQDADLRRYADGFAETFRTDYGKHHAVAEFNSPTYNGVVLSYTSLLRERGGSPAVRRMGEELEAGLWQDLADFYHPGLGTLCGPFSRAYGMGIQGTALPLLMYLALEAWPEEETPAFGPETESACVLCCGNPLIPEEIRPRLLAFEGDRLVEKQFEELAERGKPGENHSLCTATAWMKEGIMLGALRGSTNTSHQLHALTAHWRNDRGSVSGLRLRRRTVDGRLVHLRTVLFDLTASAGEIRGTVRNACSEDITCDFEIESPGAHTGAYSDECWLVDGLRCRADIRVDGRPARAPRAERLPTGETWLRFPLKQGETMQLALHFDLLS